MCMHGLDMHTSAPEMKVKGHRRINVCNLKVKGIQSQAPKSCGESLGQHRIKIREIALTQNTK